MGNGILSFILDREWYLDVVLICISLITDDVEHFFTYLFAIHLSSLMQCLFTSFAVFKIVLFSYC